MNKPEQPKKFTSQPTKLAGKTSPLRRISNSLNKESRPSTLLPVIALIILGLWLPLMHLWVKPTPLANLYNDLQNSKPTFGLPIYVPSSFPQGFSYVHQQPTTENNQILTYYLSFDGGKRLSISDRVRPKDINFDDFYSHNLNNRQAVPSSHGQAVIGTANNQAVASLLTNQVWVIISSSTQLDTARLTQLVSGLKPLP